VYLYNVLIQSEQLVNIESNRLSLVLLHWNPLHQGPSYSG